MIRIVMAGSDPQERARLRQQLTEMQVGGLPLAMEVVGQARDGQEAVHMTLVQKPDLVLLESDLPVLDGYEAAQLITLASPGTLVGLIGGAETPADLRRALRAGVREFIPRPFRPETLGAALQSLLSIEERRHSAEFVNMTDPARIPMTICVTGAKGGVGKTTITSNLACALAQENPGNVVLVDLYTQFGDVATMLNLSPRRTVADMVPLAEELDPQLVADHLEAHNSGLRVLIGSVDPKPLDFFSTRFLEELMGVLKRSYRFIIVDVPPILHPGTLYMIGHSQAVVLVANLFDLTTASDTKKLLDAVKGKQVPEERLRVVLNRVSKENQLQIKDIERAFSHPIAATIPNDGKLVPTSINRGVPFVITHPDSAIAMSIKEFMGNLTGKPRIEASASSPTSDRKSWFARRFAWQTS
jgi:pilus assembly protein CpaE